MFDEVNSEPLETALNRIAAIVRASESDPDLMRKMLVDIRDAAQDGILGYQNNITAFLAAMANA
jgi:hypothetical protein